MSAGSIGTKLLRPMSGILPRLSLPELPRRFQGESLPPERKSWHLETGEGKGPNKMAMGQNPVPLVNIPIPTKIDSEWVVPYPRPNKALGFLVSLPPSKSGDVQSHGTLRKNPASDLSNLGNRSTTTWQGSLEFSLGCRWRVSGKQNCRLDSVAFCSPAKSLTVSGLMESPLICKKLKS